MRGTGVRLAPESVFDSAGIRSLPSASIAVWLQRVSKPPSAQSPFARPLRRSVLARDAWEGVTPPSSPHTGSCARPSPSESLGCPFGTRSLQVVVAPCWEMALPDIIPACLASAPGPIPRRLPPVPVPISSRRASASAPGKGAWQTDRPDDATSTGAVLSRLQSFAPLQAPTLAWPPGCTHRGLHSWAIKPAGPDVHQIA